MHISEKIDPELRVYLRRQIEDAQENEILAIGRVDSNCRIVEIRVVARGNSGMVPALQHHTEAGDVIIHNHPSGVLTPSGADLNIAVSLGNQGIGFYIVDNDVDSIYVVSEPVIITESTPLDKEKLSGILLPGGALDRAVAFYEVRDSQIAMLEAVADAYNDDHICVTEAGTGVGKSLAYLLPSLAWAVANNERVVVSTATINLQHQLIDKDIPLVRKLLSTDAKVVLVKGRGNYICRRRLLDALEEDSLFREETDQLNSIREWVEVTPTGSKSDLSFLPDGATWRRVCSEADACMGLRCRDREKCFVMKVRREASSASLLVTNHHLLFADLAMRVDGAGFEGSAVLPPYTRIVFDEAHNLEESARSYFSKSMIRFGIRGNMARLLSEKKGRRYGLALRIQGRLKDPSIVERLPGGIESVRTQVDRVDLVASDLMAGASTYRLVPQEIERLQETLIPALIDLQKDLQDVSLILGKALESLKDEDDEDPVIFETRTVRRRIEDSCSVCRAFTTFQEDAEHVYWLEIVRGRETSVRFIITPLEVADILSESLFDQYPTIVCTSATLAIKASFSFWMKNIGLQSNERVVTHIFSSPFDYPGRVLVSIPAEGPLPNEPEYIPFVTEAIGDTLEVSEGRGLVLFTSYSMLRETYAGAYDRLAAAGITMLRQGDDDRARLLETFITDSTSVLFATDSFWEGIDVPGDSLLVVIICRLPFSVPTDPVVRARIEAIERRGGNSFYELSLPSAVIKLKQGFGRLMRRTSDKGVVLILDSRIVKKSYGSLFLSSLPETGLAVKPWKELIEDIERFLYDPRFTHC